MALKSDILEYTGNFESLYNDNLYESLYALIVTVRINHMYKNDQVYTVLY